MTKTPRQQLGAWLREAIAGQTEIDAPELARTSLAAFEADHDFLIAWWRDTGYPVAYSQLTQICADSRDLVVRHDGPQPQPARTGWFARLEHVGGRYLRFGEMTRPDLLAFAEERERPVLTELRLIGLARTLADRMPGDACRVREVFSEDDIDRWDQEMTVSYEAAPRLARAIAAD